MISQWTREQKNVVVASFLGWSLDAFDFFLLVFVLKDVAHTFGTDITKVTLAITLTLAMRPIGAVLFGRLADHFGRRPILMLDILLFSLFEFCSALSPNLTTFIVFRSLFGIAMGGEWGIGSALAMESIPVESRGVVSGILQAGYPFGYLFASIVFGLLYQSLGWRGMMMLGIIPAILVFYIRRHVPESPGFKKSSQQQKPHFLLMLKKEWKLACYAIILMTAFNFFSHGSQDLYPTFLEVQHHFSTHTVSIIAIIYNVGAILGGITIGTLSGYIGRRKAIMIASLCALPLLPLWAFSSSPVLLAFGAFLMQFAVQGAWGVIPVHLNELSPTEIRATFPGLVYQLGNLLASMNTTLQAFIAAQFNGNYSYGLAMVVGTVAVIITLLVLIGPERKGISLSA